MTNRLDLVAVSALLALRIEDGLEAQGLDPRTFEVSAHSPGSIDPKGDEELGAAGRRRLNLALYRVQEITSTSLDLAPSLVQSESGVEKSYAGVELHYLLSAHARVDSRAESLLGRAMLALRECAVLRNQDIRECIAGIGQSPSEFERTILGAKLEEDVESVRVSPIAIDFDTRAELGLTSGLEADLHTAYTVSVLLLEH